MSAPSSKRTRRSAADAKAHILACAEKVLIERGARSVQVRVVAREAGMTDAGVAHHFGNLDGLLSALMDEGAGKVRRAVKAVVAEWLEGGPDIARLVDTIDALYRDGYAELALQLHASGWRDRGSVLLEPVVTPLMLINKNPSTTEADIRAALASMHLWLAMDPIFGDAFRRSVGLRSSDGRRAQLNWWVSALSTMLRA